MTTNIFHKDTEQLYSSICSSGKCCLTHSSYVASSWPGPLEGPLPGRRAPGLHGTASRSAIFSRALQAHQALCLTLFLRGMVWVVCCCVGFSQVRGSSSQWEWQEFSKAAFGVVRNRWELKEQRATLKRFLGPQSPTGSLHFYLRTTPAASVKFAIPKNADERGIFPILLKSLEPIPVFSTLGEKILAGEWFPAFTAVQSENLVSRAFMLLFGGGGGGLNACVGMAAHAQCVCAEDRYDVSRPCCSVCAR